MLCTKLYQLFDLNFNDDRIFDIVDLKVAFKNLQGRFDSNQCSRAEVPIISHLIASAYSLLANSEHRFYYQLSGRQFFIENDIRLINWETFDEYFDLIMSLLNVDDHQALEIYKRFEQRNNNPGNQLDLSSHTIDLSIAHEPNKVDQFDDFSPQIGNLIDQSNYTSQERVETPPIGHSGTRRGGSRKISRDPNATPRTYLFELDKISNHRNLGPNRGGLHFYIHWKNIERGAWKPAKDVIHNYRPHVRAYIQTLTPVRLTWLDHYFHDILADIMGRN